MLVPSLCCLLILLAGHSSALPEGSVNETIAQLSAGEEYAESLATVQDSRKLVNAINALAKVIKESSCCEKQPASCKDLLKGGETTSGVYTIYPCGSSMQVYCDMKTDGGGWVVFQRRKDGSQNFKLGWNQYAAGFGNLRKEFWLGNKNLNLLTKCQANEMRIDMKDGNAATRFARYETFLVGSEADKFPLTIDDFTGNGGDSMDLHDAQKFSTIDQDNDVYYGDCAAEFKGGWWYAKCHRANLNGLYLNGAHSSYADGIEWYTWKGRYYSLQFTEMKMRPLY